MNNAEPARVPYLSLIDGVRGVAALAILFYHYVHFFMAGPERDSAPGAEAQFPAYDVLWPFYDYGYLAVQIFWLISGFVFAHVYDGRGASTRSFAVNRLVRLYPLHLVTLLVVTLLQFVALQRLGYTPIYGKYDLPHFTEQLFMASDWFREEGGFSFNGPVWSVSVEIVVYAIFWSLRGWIARFGLPLVAALALGFYFAQSHLGDYSKVFLCGFYFFTGCGLSIAQRGIWGQGVRLLLPVALLGVIGAIGAIAGSDWGLRYLAIPGLCGALFLVLARVELRAAPRFRRACEWLGESTYGIYLWHFPIQLVMLLVMMPGIDPQSVARSGWFLACYVALVIIVARVSYVRFEKPMRGRLRRALGDGAQAVRLGVS